MRLRQATAVAIGGRAVMIEGPPGCGKSSLALMLTDRGAVLVGDDGVGLHVERERLIASAPEATAGLLEIRNVGLVRLPCRSAPVALVIRCDDDAPRFVEQADRLEIEGIALPLLRMRLGNPADAIRVEQALALHGLRM
ncbi:HPr kinase/phosphorylase [Parerythrobacter lacustris]|uniref:HPr kinase/phosphatase C-terminal domain-containing protein n=1 Tax=Parerythrobacter lacustris TaxID=2969984 RepID=A0ABT1XX02_9SPHN|nr:HPr kinase/phosphatase C-terminal domain-containing protein [Parerythrobacter lacustris]